MEKKQALVWSGDTTLPRAIDEGHTQFSNFYENFTYRIIEVSREWFNREKISKLDFTDNTERCFTPEGYKSYLNNELLRCPQN